MSHGGDRTKDQDANLHLAGQPAEPAAISISQAAALLNVSPRSVASVSKVLKIGVPELIAALDAGNVAVSTAADIATLPKPEPTQTVARGEILYSLPLRFCAILVGTVMTANEANFEVSRERLEWARESIAEFHRESMNFLGTRLNNRVVHQDVSTRVETVKIVFEGVIPSVVQKLANRALEDIKNVFDQATFAACKTLDPTPERTFHFPWTNSEAGFLERLAGNKIPQTLHKVMHELRPYGVPDDDSHGDSLVRKLAALANNKHSIGLRVGCDIAAIRAPSFFGGENLDWESGVPVDFGKPEWSSLKNEIILATGPFGLSECLAHDCQIKFFLAIDALGRVGELPFYNVIRMFAGKAEAVVTALEAEVKSLAKVMQSTNQNSVV